MSSEITRLFDFHYFSHKKYNLDNALVTKYENKWISTSSEEYIAKANTCLLYTSPSPRDRTRSRMPSSA